MAVKGAPAMSSAEREPGMWVLGVLIVAVLVAAAALIGGYATGWGGHLRISQAAVPIAANGGTPNATLNLTIVTGQMMGSGALGPAYVPADFTLPANSTVKVTVTDFDNSTPLTGALTKFAKVTGTVGGVMQVQRINPLAPNTTVGGVHTMSYLAPSQVAHTLTIPRLGINVPMAGQSRITFVIRTGKGGTYQWLCMDPCGDGPSGMGAPMGMQGFMAGTLTVVG
ncbi:MAG: cupredoxin domain-containing protein [Candidatus Dormibacteria bacterium]